MRKIFLLVALVSSVFVNGQISTEPLHVTRPTPTVASLMNFAEIPVNLYTGVPNVSIPIYSFPTRSKDMGFNISLNYHPASISFVDKVSDTGLGWSLFSGGSIARNITNEPDDVDPNIEPGNTNRFDDVYQFNFMGYSGSFLIKKDSLNNFSLQIRDDNNAQLKIEYEMNPTTWSVDSFTIYDNKGYKYDFEVYDMNIVQLHHFRPLLNMQNINISLTQPVAYRSAHHLTKVTDNNEKVLIDISYQDYNTNTLPSNFYDNIQHKMDTVTVEGYGKAIFDYSEHPSESNLNDVLRLDNITITDLGSNIINQYHLGYSATTLEGARRLLSTLEIANKDDVEDSDYEFAYKGLPMSIIGNIEDYDLTWDKYGFLRVEKKCDIYASPSAYLREYETIPEYTDYCALESIRYPTGGAALFKYESNTYSYVNNTSYTMPIDEDDYYLDNPIDNTMLNVIKEETNFHTSGIFEFTIPTPGYYFIYTTHVPYEYPEGIEPEPGSPPQPTVSYLIDWEEYNNFYPFYLHNYAENTSSLCIGREIYFNAGDYTIDLGTPANTDTYCHIKISQIVNKPTPNKWVYGAGIRIKEMAYIPTNIPSDYFADPESYPDIIPSKHTKYAYNKFDHPDESSGFIHADLMINPYSNYFVSDIGYTNVKVSEYPTNGYEKYTFASPYDVMMTNTDTYWPDVMAFRNGNLLKKETFDINGNPLMLTENAYTYLEDGNDPFNFNIVSGLNTRSCWVKLDSTTTTAYLGGNSITTGESFTYNTTNRLVATSTKTNSLGENVTTSYTYDTANSSVSDNRIAEILSVEIAKNSTVLSKSEIDYDNTWTGNLSYLPKTIKTSKDNQTLEDRLHYNLYDEYSNPLEIQKEGGTPVSYIWGYNKTQPIAKIENATNAAIATALGSDPVDADETDMTAINALRSSMPDAMVTTYTYKPLVGITTITDPKGDKLTYVYDDFNRLQYVKDKNNNILSENQYDYNLAGALNYVKSTTYRDETTTAISNPDPDQAVVNKTFYDGLGRPIQQIAHKQSNTGKDIITHIEYDHFGRKAKDYLPYVNDAASLAYDIWARDNSNSYYNNVGISEKGYEQSPLHRILKQGAPGDDWQVAASGPDHTIKFENLAYDTNVESVNKYYAIATWDTNTELFEIALTEDNDYVTGDLYKSVVKNENWVSTDGDNNTIHEFKDKDGKVILKRSFGVSDLGGTPTNTIHDTYYIYDQYDNLTYVLPPLVDTTSSITTTILDDLCYQYKYDHRNRLVEKKLPGKEWEYIVYDKLDRVIATGPTLPPFNDISQSQYGWMLTKFDAFGRNILTAWKEGDFSSADRKDLQDDYDGTSGPLYEVRSASASTVNNVVFEYTNLAEPTSGYHVMSVNYFDDYDYPGAPSSIPTHVMDNNAQPVFYNNTLKPKGLATGSWIRILEESSTYPVKADVSYILYDIKARPVRTRTNNYLGGYTQADSEVAFDGKVNVSEVKHKRTSSDSEIFTHEEFKYSQQGRLTEHTHQVDSGTVEVLSKPEYDELGKLIAKKVGGAAATPYVPLQYVGYEYNMRGWLTKINEPLNLYSPYYPQDLFAMKINYNEPITDITNYDGRELYNGNISEISWISASDNTLRKYGYQYDDLNRLTNAIYMKPNASTPVTNSYDESMRYDKNGNITSLQRYGDLDTDAFNIQMDDLVYTYDPDKKDRLLKVNDLTNHPLGFTDDALTDTADDYRYDSFGNMTQDENKAIDRIKYNHLNLPTTISFVDTNKKIEYLYNAAGSKVKKVVTEGLIVTTTDYLGGFQYQQVSSGNTELKFFPHAEGYVNNTVISNHNVYNYVYNYTDHLGNVRMSYTWDVGQDKLVIMEENNYYPYGLKHSNYNAETWTFKDNIPYGNALMPTTDPLAYQHKYNGKEWQHELGLNMYAMDMRQYDPAIARWVAQDPIVHHNQSPYNAFDGNPVYFADPSGGNSMSAQGLDMWGRPTHDDMGLFIPMYMRGPGATSTLFNALEGTDGGTRYLGGGPGGTGGHWEKYIVRMVKSEKSYVDEDGEDKVHIVTEPVYGMKFIPSSDTEFWKNTLEYVGAGLSMKQLRMIEMRKGLTVNDRIGTFRQFSTRYNNVARMVKYSGRINNVLTAYSLYTDYNDPKVSKARFAYRSGGVGASLLTSSVAGFYGGGPGGALAGFVVGLGTAAGETVYDGWNNTVMPTINQGTYSINNEHGYTNFHP